MKNSRVFVMGLVILWAHLGWGLQGGDLVNNGGGLAEKNMFYAYEKMEKYLQLCLGSDSCKLTNEQRDLVLKILKSLPQEKANQNQLVFLSEKKAPGTFIIDGQVRIAKTGSAVGSSIMVNVDLLYSKGANGYEAMSLPEAVAVLVHEFGHHHGNFSHEDLDLIAVRISVLLQQKTISTPLLPWNSFVSASVLGSSSRADFPQVLLTVGEEVIDLSDEYKKAVHCEVLTIPIPILPLPDLELVTKVPAGSILHNIHWDKVKEKDGSLVIKIVGSVSNTCVYKNDVEMRNNNFQMSIRFVIKKTNDTWKYDPTTLELDQFKDPWWKLIKLP